MSAFSGKDGIVKVGAVQVAEVTKRDVELTVEVAKYASSSTAGWKAAVVGPKDITGNVEAMCNDTGVAPFGEGDIVTLLLATDSGATPKGSLTGSAVIKSLSYEVDPGTGAPVSWKASFEGNGAWTKTGVFSTT